MDTNKGAILKIGLFPELQKMAKKFKKANAHSDRAQIIADLKVMLEIAFKCATAIPEGGGFTKERQRCAQHAAYIARSINFVATVYDTMKIKKILEEIMDTLRPLSKHDRKVLRLKRLVDDVCTSVSCARWLQGQLR